MNLLLLLEIVSVVFNIVFLILLIKEKKQCWIYGIIGSLLGAYVFYEKMYFSESILYLFYVFLGIYGFYYWDKKNGQKFVIKRSSTFHVFVYILIGLSAGLGLGYAMSYTNADKPYYDAMSTAFGVLASFLELYKYFVAWSLWIVINAYSVWLYGEKELNFFAIQMVLYTATSIYGLVNWHKKLAVQK